MTSEDGWDSEAEYYSGISRFFSTPVLVPNRIAQPAQHITPIVYLPASDIEMLEPSYESQAVLFVLDTNILLNAMDWLEGFREWLEASSNSALYVQMVVPWAVVAELDGLKKSDETGYSARVATKWILHYMGRGLVGQERTQEYYESGDDSILACAVELARGWRPPTGVLVKTLAVVLVTNDANLAVRGVVSGVKVATQTDLQGPFSDFVHQFV